MKQVTIALAQLNPVVGDIQGNKKKILAVRDRYPNVDLIVFTECVLTGYPVEDLVKRPHFMRDVMAAINEISAEVAKGGPAIVYGSPVTEGTDVFNAAVITIGKKTQFRMKCELPNYDVFDEKRVFKLGLPADNTPIMFNDFDMGVMICEDTWFPRVASNLYKGGADFLLSINGSPFQADKDALRKSVVAERLKECPNTPIIYTNQVGGQDEIIFDGGSFVMDANGQIVTQLEAFAEDVKIIKLTKTNRDIVVTPESRGREYPGVTESVYRALMLGLRDYVGKNGFPGVVLGLSGGIDSGLVAALAADALGPDKVWAVRLPSKWTSDESNDLATAQCERMGIFYSTIAIGMAVDAAEDAINLLDVPFANRDPKGLMEENLQSRERGQTLMALSNRYGLMVVSTGNKSEYSTGYATLYGDMCGGYALLKDVWKLVVFDLARWRNQNQPIGSRLPRGPKQRIDVIPSRVIERPPTAELKDGQSDEESLMPYEFLDPLLIAMVEDEKSNDEIVAMLTERFGSVRDWVADVNKMRRLIDLAEYKRRQAAPGPKVTSKSYGKGRRYPITNGYREICSVEG